MQLACPVTGCKRLGRPSRSFQRQLPGHTFSTNRRQIPCRAQETSKSSVTVDHFPTAAIRLQNLLTRAGGDDELVLAMLQQATPEAKLQLAAVSGGIGTLIAFLLCSFCGKDPWGGASLSLHSLEAAAVGALYAAPLVLFRVFTWTSKAAGQLVPSLSDMRRYEREQTEAMLSGLSKAQVACVLALDTFPEVFLFLPAVQGAVITLAGLGQGLEVTNGSLFPAELVLPLAMGVSCTAAAAVSGTEISPAEEEVEVVDTALENADRFYRLMALDHRGSAEDAAQAAKAFRAVVMAWRSTRDDACRLAATFGAFDILSYSLIWHGTHDLTAALVAAMAIRAVDYHYYYGMSGGSSAVDRQM